MRITYSLIILAAIIIFGCNPDSKQSTKSATTLTSSTWIIDDYNMEDSEEEVSSPYSFLRFFNDSTFNGVALRGYFTGKWLHKPAKQQIWLYPDSTYFDILREDLIVIEVIENKGDEMQWVLMQDFDGNYSKKFASMNARIAVRDSAKDPLNHEVNWFRQKPSASEDADQIKARVKNYLTFMESFSLFSAENNIPMPDTYWFPTPLIIHLDGSIRMAYSDELNSWNSCFYNEAQAVEGYKLMSGPLQQLKLKSKENIHVRNAAFIAALQNSIK